MLIFITVMMLEQQKQCIVGSGKVSDISQSTGVITVSKAKILFCKNDLYINNAKVAKHKPLRKCIHIGKIVHFATNEIICDNTSQPIYKASCVWTHKRPRFKKCISSMEEFNLQYDLQDSQNNMETENIPETDSNMKKISLKEEVLSKEEFYSTSVDLKESCTNEPNEHSSSVHTHTQHKSKKCLFAAGGNHLQCDNHGDHDICNNAQTESIPKTDCSLEKIPLKEKDLSKEEFNSTLVDLKESCINEHSSSVHTQTKPKSKKCLFAPGGNHLQCDNHGDHDTCNNVETESIPKTDCTMEKISLKEEVLSKEEFNSTTLVDLKESCTDEHLDYLSSDVHDIFKDLCNIEKFVCYKKISGRVRELRGKFGIMTAFLQGVQFAVAFHIMNLFIDGKKCDTNQKLRKYIKVGTVLKCNARRLPENHPSKVPLVSLCSWVGEPPVMSKEFLQSTCIPFKIRGAKAYIKRYISDTEGVIEFSFEDQIVEAVFHQSQVKSLQLSKGIRLKDYLKINRTVLFNGEIVSQPSVHQSHHINVTHVWVSKKLKKKYVPLKHLSVNDNLLPREGALYKGIVTTFLSPFACVVDLNDFDVSVLLLNYYFCASSGEPLQHGHSLISHLAGGDVVCLAIQRSSPESNNGYEWVASKAWHEEQDIIDNLEEEKMKPIVDNGTFISKPIKKGKVFSVSAKLGWLICEESSIMLQFLKENLYFFGISLVEVEVGLDQLQLEDEVINFMLGEEESLNCEYSQVSVAWIGPHEVPKSKQEVALQTVQVFNYCKSKNISSTISTILVKQLGELQHSITQENFLKSPPKEPKYCGNTVKHQFLLKPEYSILSEDGNVYNDKYICAEQHMKFQWNDHLSKEGIEQEDVNSVPANTSMIKVERMLEGESEPCSLEEFETEEEISLLYLDRETDNDSDSRDYVSLPHHKVVEGHLEDFQNIPHKTSNKNVVASTTFAPSSIQNEEWNSNEAYEELSNIQIETATLGLGLKGNLEKSNAMEISDALLFSHMDNKEQTLKMTMDQSSQTVSTGPVFAIRSPSHKHDNKNITEIINQELNSAHTDPVLFNTTVSHDNAKKLEKKAEQSSQTYFEGPLLYLKIIANI